MNERKEAGFLLPTKLNYIIHNWRMVRFELFSNIKLMTSMLLHKKINVKLIKQKRKSRTGIKKLTVTLEVNNYVIISSAYTLLLST